MKTPKKKKIPNESTKEESIKIQEHACTQCGNQTVDQENKIKK